MRILGRKHAIFSAKTQHNNSVNNVMYLPLDKMAPSAGSGVLPGAMSRGLTSQQLREVTDAVTEQLRRDLNGRNQRGGR